MKKLTIGMPVYNGAAKIAAALDSLLAQSFADFDIVISDNGSTDGTPSVCEGYTARDPRVRYVRQLKNLGPQMNFRFVLFEAHTPYFMWAAADDLWASSFAERNIAALEADPSLVMSQSQVLFAVDGAPSHMASGTYPLQEDARANAAQFFRNPADNSRYYGVFRTEALKKVFPIRPFYALDWFVSAATLRYGKHHEIPEVLMIRDSSDPASYARAVMTDHRFILWRIFPLLFMTRKLLLRRMVPLSPALLFNLLKANLYLHFRFGLYKFDGMAERYLASNSIRRALAFWARKPKAEKVRWAEGIDAFHGGNTPPVPSTLVPPVPGLVQARWSLPAEAGQPPRLSLVIINDSGLNDSLRALAAAHHMALLAPIEVILVCATRGGFSPAIFDALKGITVVEMAAQETAGAMINAGLEKAGGLHLLILRAQAWYGADLLSALEEALAAAVLVAPQILYPDGRLAAAGGVVTANGGAWPHGRMSDPNEPGFAFARACDYAPTALAGRRSAFEGRQPFDPSLRNFDLAVAEFCLRRRSQNGAPLYWPLARVVGPAEIWRPDGLGTVVPAGWVEDWMTLRQRHINELLRQATLEAEGRPSHDRACPRRMLYIDAVTPAPDQNAGSIEVVSQLKVLGDFGFRITFVPESNFAYHGAYTKALQKLGVETVHFPYATSVRAVLEAARGPFDVVVLCRAYIAERYLPMVRELAPQAKVIFYPVDLHFLREQREAALNGDADAAAAAERSKATELASVASADATIVHSSLERDLLLRELPGARVMLLPMTRAVPATLTAPGPEARRDIIFVGTYQHPPNEDAAIFFAREVWPLLRSRLPEARFLLIGSAMTAKVEALTGDGVEVLGFVPDLQPLLETARIAVAPVRFGAGLKGKVATTLQAGLPTVVTSVAAEGFGLQDGREVLIAETVQDLADAVVRLYTDDALWRSLAREGFAFAQRKFSFEANTPLIAQLLAELGVATLDSERVLLEADLAQGDPVFRPSHFWQALSQAHTAQLAETDLMRFKRTLNNCYMQWLPGSFEDPRFVRPWAALHASPSMIPVEIAASAPPQPELECDVEGYGGFRPFANPDYLRFYAFYSGLLWHLMTLHASDDLYKRLEEPALGAPITLRHMDQAISQDLAQSLLEYSRIKELTRELSLPERSTYLELGAGYGRLAYVLLSARTCRYIIVDIPPTILVAKWYLSRVFPQRRVFGYRSFADFAEVRAELEDAELIFLSPNQLGLLPDGYADVSISISSLHEMSMPQIARYKELLQSKTRLAIYLKQWARWHNPVDDIDVCTADFALGPPWMLVLNATDLANEDFVEQGWHSVVARGQADKKAAP
jgi:putative sugar O-methyltransferase